MHPELPTLPLTPEQTHLRDLEQRITDETKGKISLHSSIDFSPAEKATIADTILERTPEGTPLESPGRGGWGDYGEVATQTPDRSDSLLKLPFGGTAEKLVLLKQSDGKTRVMYGFTSKFYVDGTGRPGNAMRLGFEIDSETAAQLHDVLVQNPSHIREVVRQQCLAIGISNPHYAQFLAPKYQQFEAPGTFPDGTSLEIATFASDQSPTSETESIPFSRREPLLMSQSNSPEKSPDGISREEDILTTTTREYAQMLAKEHPPVKVLSELCDEMIGIRQEIEANSSDHAKKSLEAYKIVALETLESILESSGDVDQNVINYTTTLDEKFVSLEAHLETVREQINPPSSLSSIKQAEHEFTLISEQADVLEMYCLSRKT